MKTSCPECRAYPCESITHLDGSPGVKFKKRTFHVKEAIEILNVVVAGWDPISKEAYRINRTIKGLEELL